MEKEGLNRAKENHEKDTPRPNLLDVVKIDDRWAQVRGAVDYICYLGSNEFEDIDWNDFKLIKDWMGLKVSTVKETEIFTKQEINNIHWGPEEKEFPHLKETVSVFGEFVKKK